jgi:stringent starvation protein B
MAEVSTKPYFIRAIYEWCSDCGFTPYLSVRVDERTRVPMEYVKNGEIVLNVSLNATRNLTVNNELIQFSARFNGVSREVSIPIDRVQGIFARENGQGAFFTVEAPAALTAAMPSAVAATPAEVDAEPPKPPAAAAGKTRLKLVK